MNFWTNFAQKKDISGRKQEKYNTTIKFSTSQLEKKT